MKLIQEELDGNSIINYTEDTVIIAGSEERTLGIPCFISNGYITALANVDELSSYLEKSQIEVLIIGSVKPLHPKQIVELKQHIECETMSIISAIYSYNILLGDMRSAGVLLLK